MNNYKEITFNKTGRIIVSKLHLIEEDEFKIVTSNYMTIYKCQLNQPIYIDDKLSNSIYTDSEITEELLKELKETFLKELSKYYCETIGQYAKLMNECSEQYKEIRKNLSDKFEYCGLISNIGE
jgi:uncharacterized protein YjgD (DUF1641 family)